MKRFAFLSTAFALKRLYKFSNAKIHINGRENIPQGPLIFTVNHFTRIETLFLPYHLEELSSKPIWSLAHHSLFTGALGGFLEKGGAVSTADPDRDKLILKSLITDKANWIIFPEGGMIKSKKLVSDNNFIVESDEGSTRPRTGAANLALRAEFYRLRILKHLEVYGLKAAEEICRAFDIEDPEIISTYPVHIVPVNITYFPLRARENALNRFAAFLIDSLPERFNEELMTEGSMLLDGVDVDIRFGPPLKAFSYLEKADISLDIERKDHFGTDDKIASLSSMRKAAMDLMQDYMAAIYSMTTVNPDHLFASILNEMKEDLIDIDDFRRRVYLAASMKFEKKNFYLHKSLASSQIHLITDDSFGRWADFLAYAQDTGVLSLVDKSSFKRNSLKLRSDYDFHNVRITNPIRVMFNEIEPLNSLKLYLSHIAEKSREDIKKELVDYLLQKGIKAFESAGVRYGMLRFSGPEDGGRPFLLKGGEKRTGVLLLHGYLGYPAQMSSFAERLNKKGFWVYVPRLPGHGTSPVELEKTEVKDWEEAVLEACALLHTLCDKLVVAGLSLGALLASSLALKFPDISALCLVGMPYKLDDYKLCGEQDEALWEKIVSYISAGKKEHLDLPCSKDNLNPGYREHPARAFREMAALMERLRSNLSLLSTPCLILHAGLDPLVLPSSSLAVFQRLKQREKELHLLAEEQHDLFNGEPALRSERILLDFISLCEKNLKK